MHKKLTYLTLATLTLSSSFLAPGRSAPSSSNSIVLAQEAETKQVFTDDLGREVEIPASLESVLGTGAASQVVLYTLAPERMIGWNSQPYEDDLAYLPAEAKDLPEVGSVFGKKALNMEEIIDLAPDLIIDMGDKKKDIEEELDQIQDQTGIPIIFLEAGSLEDLPQLYQVLGDLLEVDTRAQVAYLEETLALAAEHRDYIQEEELTFYYAGGDDGLFTSSQGNFRTEVFDLVGLTNVFQLGEGEKPSADEVTFEQILDWDPETIVFSDERSYRVLEENDLWETLPAVQAGSVYAAPDHPFNWLTGPKSVNAVLGIRWLGNLYYPELYDFDLVQAAQDFYDLFYGYDLSDEEAAELLDLAISSDTGGD